MGIKTKYQYSYFIYPYIVEEKKYEKHLYKLLTNRDCKIKQFEREKDSQIYQFFLPKIRDYMFWNIGLNKVKNKKLGEFDKKMQAVLLNKYPCTIFEYNIEKDIQGKTGDSEGIFFDIKKVEIICFKPGICFILIKTMLSENALLEELCDFNYQFRDICSASQKEQKFENIKIQTDVFKNMKGIQTFIKEITGNNKGAKELNIDTERFITYSYACAENKEFSEDELKNLDKLFQKYANIEPSDSLVDKTPEILNLDQNTKLGFVNNGTVLFTSDTNIENYTKLSEKYENEYLYCYIYELYRKYYLKKLNQDFKLGYQFNKTKAKFVDFTQKLMIEDITNDNIGAEVTSYWEDMININEVFSQTKQKYDLLYKNINIEKTARSNKIIAIILAILVIVNIINSLNLHK